MRRLVILISLFVAFVFHGKAQAPTVHAKSLSSSNVYCHQLDLTWTNGNGDGRVIVAKEGAKVDSVPLKDKFYPGDLNFGDGEELGTENYVLYSGTSNTISITGLKKNTTYYFAVYEYNISNPDVDYLTVTGYAEHNVTTENITSSFSIDNTFQCLYGNEIKVVANSSNSLGNTMTYSYDYGDKNTATGSSNSHKYTEGGIFGVELTTESTGCKDVAVRLDTIVVPYVTGFFLDKTISPNDSIQCLIGNQFHFFNESYRPKSPVYNSFDATNFRWYTNGVLKGTGQHHNIKFTDPGTYQIKLVTGRRIKKDAKAPVCKDSFEATYVVLPEPLQPGDVAFKDTLLCLGADNFEFNHTSTTAISQKWHFGDGDSSDLNPAFHSYGQVGKFEVALTVEDDSGCISNFTDTVEVISIPNNTISGLLPEYCKGDPIAQLKPNIGGGYFDGINVSRPDSTFDPKDTGDFTVDYILQVGNCLDTARAMTRVLDVPNFSLGNDTIICEGSNFNLNPMLPSSNLRWNDNSGASTKSINTAGIYWLEVTEGKCKFRDSINVRTMRAPLFEFGKDTTLCGGEIFRLDALSVEATYSWDDGSTDSIRNISESGFYKVTVTNKCGTFSDEIRIEILPFACEIYIPNAFSPNGDNLNNTFYPQGYFEFSNMEIYNRWGELLYETEELDKGWDGTANGVDVQAGVYFFVIRYELPDEEGRLTKKRASGPVMLVR